MKKRSAILAFLLVFSGAVFLFGQDVIEEIVAVVNDDIITLSQFRAEHEDFLQALRGQFKGEEFEKRYAAMKENLLEKMITDLLLLQEAKKMEGMDPDEQLRLWLENLKKENNINTDAELIRALQEQGVDFEEWKKKMKENMMRDAVIGSEVRRNIVVDDSEIVSYYKLHPEEFTELPEYKLRAIYLSAEGGNEEVEAKKREISEKISSGEDIGSLASKYSEGPEKENQGELGSFKKGELEKDLEQAVEQLKVGEIAPWLKVRAGWFLLKLEEKKESRLKSFEEARSEIEAKFFNEKSQKKLEEFLKKLKEKSLIKILIPNPLDYM
jgi:parvulin-like peptidyl-prolyl isomerase